MLAKKKKILIKKSVILKLRINKFLLKVVQGDPKKWYIIVRRPQLPSMHIKQVLIAILKIDIDTLFLVQTNHKWVE